MITVPAALSTEVAKLRGRRLTARVRIDYSDANIDNTVSGAADTVAAGSYVDQCYNGKEDITLPWASLDDSWELGDYALAPETSREQSDNEIGWWADTLALPDGSMPDAAGAVYGHKIYGHKVLGRSISPPALTLCFTPRTIAGLRLSFDNARNEFGVDFDVDLLGVGDVVLDTLPYTGNAGLRVTTTFTAVPLVAALRVTITKWSHPGRQPKVAEFYTAIAETYGAGDIISLRVTEARESGHKAQGGSTASGSCVLTLYNRDRKFDYDNTGSKLYNFIRAGVRITPEIGDGTNWIPLGIFFARAWDVDANSLTVTVTGLDYMAALGETEYRNSQIIQAPATQSFDTDTGAEWSAGVLIGLTVSGDTVRL